MKQTTIDMLDSAMALNVEIQEDNLNLQEMKQHLLQLCRQEEILTTRSSFESISENPDNIKNHISMELLSMIDSGIADLDKKYNYPHFTEVQDQETVTYNAGTIWNMCTCFRSMLSSLGNLGKQDLSYEEFRQAFLDNNQINLLLTRMSISDEDYVEANIPQPKKQSLTDADMSKDNLNASGKALNSIVTDEILKNLAETKYEISAKMEKNQVDAIKSAHFVSQVTMAIKNAILLMKNYHEAALNELIDVKEESLDKLLSTATKCKKSVRDAYNRCPERVRGAVIHIDSDLTKFGYRRSYVIREVVSQIAQWTYYTSTTLEEIDAFIKFCYMVNGGIFNAIREFEKEKKKKK